MNEYNIGDTFEEMEYEEMAASQTNVDTFTFQTITLSWCPIQVTLTI